MPTLARVRSILLVAALSVAGLAAPAAAKKKDAIPPPANDGERLERLTVQLAAAFDTARGGFVGKDGRPAESAVELAFALGRSRASDPDGAWRSRALHTVGWTTAMLMDTLSGGFASRRAASTAEGSAFVMRADINGRRLANLVLAWQATGDPRWRTDAARVVNYVERILLDGRGGFVTAQVGDRGLEPASNGVAIHAWLRWAAATGDTRPRDFALRSIDRVWETSHDPLGVLLRRGDFGEVMEFPQLADQVEMGRALLFAAQVCGRAQDLVRARSLAQVLVDKFEDREKGGLMTQASPRKDGTIRRAARVADENARAALFFAELAAATGEPAWSDAAQRTVAAFERDREKAGLDGADWALALRTTLAPEPPVRAVWQSAPTPAPTPSVMRFKLPRRR